MDQKVIDRIGESWAKALGDEFAKPYMKEVGEKVRAARKVTNVYPEPDNVFRAFRETPLDKVKVVWLSQDPYNTPGQATGLAMDCGQYISPTMKQIQYAYDQEFPNAFNTDIYDGHLLPWAKQGVFLLNTALTVEERSPKSHIEIWQKFTAAVMEVLVRHPNPKVFVFLGRDAQRYSAWVGAPHTQIMREHPQAANYEHRNWNHMQIFTKINGDLKHAGVEPIDW